MNRKVSASVHLEDLRLVVENATENVIDATVAAQEDWKQESFIKAMANMRHLKRLVEMIEQDLCNQELEVLAQAAVAGERDLATLKCAAEQRGGAS